MTAITLDNICKTYRAGRNKSVTALDRITLKVEQGEAFGFIGPNGAGKSTAIKILTGAVFPTTGYAALFDLNVADSKSRRGLGYVPENPSLYDYLTPMEILRMGVRIHGIKHTDTQAHCMRWLERFDIAHVANKRLRGFSKGMMQRTALAHALACDPKLLILDEPLSGLDPIGRKDVVDILMEYRRNGGTIFFSSHVLHDVERLADRYGLIHRGVLRTISSPSDLVSADEDWVVVRSIGSSKVSMMEPDVGDRWHTRVQRIKLWSLLDQLKAAEHQILEVKSELSLEQVFLKYVKES